MSRAELVMFHEAGHAVMAHLFGLSVEEVSANPAGDSSGHMNGLPGEKEWVARAAVFGGDLEVVHRWLLTLAVGPAAKSIAGGELLRSYPFPWELWGGEHDKTGAERLLGAAGGLDVELDDIMDEAIELLQERDIWAAVERVVRELQHFGGEFDYELFIGAFMGLAPLR